MVSDNYYKNCLQVGKIKIGPLFIQMEFKVRAGRFTFDKDSKKVKVSKDKGLIHIVRVPPVLFRTKTKRRTSSGLTYKPMNNRSI